MKYKHRKLLRQIFKIIKMRFTEATLDKDTITFKEHCHLASSIVTMEFHVNMHNDGKLRFGASFNYGEHLPDIIKQKFPIVGMKTVEMYLQKTRPYACARCQAQATTCSTTCQYNRVAQLNYIVSAWSLPQELDDITLIGFTLQDFINKSSKFLAGLFEIVSTLMREDLTRAIKKREAERIKQALIQRTFIIPKPAGLQ